ncbi:hypothetical protein KJ641_01630 [Patescibacteria group bacterium]|nr:hypothetical protein [Patescibacteria group bacterium]
MRQTNEQLILNLLNTKDNFAEIFIKIEKILAKKQLDKVDTKLKREHITNVLKLFITKKIFSAEVYNWASLVLQLCSDEIIDYDETCYGVLSSLLLMEEEETDLSMDSVEFLLKELWPLGAKI